MKRLGLDFGLWVEPEMVNDDSDLARAHPDWVLRGRSAPAPLWRHQQVLDLQHPDAYAHVRDALLALLAEYDIAFLKWDHNRDLVDVAHAGRPAVHGQTLAFYRLLDELREAHPDLEIESCASGGGRIDLEVLTRTDRVWPSDTIDAVERQRIQRWTSLLVPPEMLGAHLGGPVAHTTGRTHSTGFRAATALLGHLGIEWDLRDGRGCGARRGGLVGGAAQAGAPAGLDGPAGPRRPPRPRRAGHRRRGGGPLRGVVRRRDRRHAARPVGRRRRTAGTGPRAPYVVTDQTPSGSRHRAGLGEHLARRRRSSLTGRMLGEVGVGFPPLAPGGRHVLRATSG